MAAEIFPTKLPSIVERMCPAWNGFAMLGELKPENTIIRAVFPNAVHSLGQNGISHENGQSSCRFSPVVNRNNAWNTSLYPGKRIIFLLRQNRPQNLNRNENATTIAQWQENKFTATKQQGWANSLISEGQKQTKKVNTPLYLNRILDFMLCPCRCSLRVQQSIWLGNGP